MKCEHSFFRTLKRMAAAIVVCLLPAAATAQSGSISGKVTLDTDNAGRSAAPRFNGSTGSVVTVYDAGYSADGSPYLVMELVEDGLAACPGSARASPPSTRASRSRRSSSTSRPRSSSRASGSGRSSTASPPPARA